LFGLGFSYLLYRGKHPWSKTWNRILFALRAALAFFLAFLLLGPIVKQIHNLFEKPIFVLVYDNSISVRETTDSMAIHQLEMKMNETADAVREKGYDVRITDLSGEEVKAPAFTATASDLTGTLKRIASRYESNQIGGVLLVSDGIYNEGVSPLYTTYNFPIYTLGIGDTLQRTDILVKDIAYNKIVYQGNRFPLRAEIMVKNLDNQNINVSLLRQGKVIEKQSKPSVRDQLLVFDFQPMAEEQGIQKLDIQVEVKQGEINTVNNRASAFVEVVQGKKKILIIAPSPHPDIKALREVVDKNPNYEFLLHIPGIDEQPSANLSPDKIDLVIFHHAPDLRGKTRELFQQFALSRTSMFVVIGPQTDWQQLVKQGMPISFESVPRDFDEVVPVTNPLFTHFIISPETNGIIQGYPPVSVPFGKINLPGNAMPLLFQRVGNLTTEKPLLFLGPDDSRKIGIMLGEGLWRWRLNEFDRFERTTAFDELFGKLIQFLSTSDDKRKFRSYPVKQEFNDTETVVFESQVYDDIFEPVYGNTIDIELTGDDGKKSGYAYTINPGNVRYQIGGLPEGVYKYSASTMLNQKKEEVRGEFAVVRRQAELQNLTADFELLRKLSQSTGGLFLPASKSALLKSELEKTEAKSTIHSEETYNSLINLKWVFWLLLLVVGTEWFSRRFFGSY